jgi:hypothetical protein
VDAEIKQNPRVPPEQISSIFPMIASNMEGRISFVQARPIMSHRYTSPPEIPLSSYTVRVGIGSQSEEYIKYPRARESKRAFSTLLQSN